MFSFYKWILLISDIIVVNLALWLTLVLRFDLETHTQVLEFYAEEWIVLTLIHLTVNMGFRLYRCLLRYVTAREVLYIGGATILSCTLFYTYGHFINQSFPNSVYIGYTCIVMLLMILSRLSYKLVNYTLTKCSKTYIEIKNHFNKLPKQRTLLIGAGDAASLIVVESKKHCSNGHKIVLALDDDKMKHRATLHGIPIMGPIDRLLYFVEKYTIDTIIIAMPSVGQARIAEILELCSQTDCTLRIFSGIDGALSEGEPTYHIRPVKIEDLLGRDEIMMDAKEVKAKISGHTVLVTGGGGSIGSELCRQISAFNPSRLIIFDIYENNAYDLQNELLRNGFSKSQLTVLIGSVRDKHKLDEVFRIYKPDLVFHAAAHKHVPLMEDSPSEAIKNNVFGTLNVALCARKYRTCKFVLISTDKAVNPTNVMGATKRLCEMIIQSINSTTSYTDFVAVRFGNVLGSNGSVIPLFRRQLEAGGPLTVTHPDIIRYFMTIPEAVRLILQAMTFAEGGEIFILDMGKPVKILDLARKFIKLSGFEPDRDIPIIFTGLRPGEKLYEELLMDEEGMQKTPNKKIFIGRPSDITFLELMEQLKFLNSAIESGEDLKQALRQVVSTYQTPDHDMTNFKIG